MPTKKKNSAKDRERSIFDSLRKPTAPPSKTIGTRKPEEKAHPALRKIKHKNRENEED